MLLIFALFAFILDIKEQLIERNLLINAEKTEQYIVNKKANGWKKCQVLGTLLDTTADIKRRKILITVEAQKHKYIFNNKNIAIT